MAKQIKKQTRVVAKKKPAYPPIKQKLGNAVIKTTRTKKVVQEPVVVLTLNDKVNMFLTKHWYTLAAIATLLALGASTVNNYYVTKTFTEIPTNTEVSNIHNQ